MGEDRVLRYANITVYLSLNKTTMNSTASGISRIVADALTTQPIPFATLTVSINGVHKGGATTNMNGAFHIKPLDPGFYSLEATLWVTNRQN